MKDSREYRAIDISKFEFRAEKTAEGKEKMCVRGYASTFEQYLLFEEDETKYYERIEPTAFDETDMTDCVFRKDHEGTVFARTSNGALSISIDEHGLLTETDLSRTTSGQQMFEEIREGCYPQMSFAFTAEGRVERDEDNNFVRIITKVKKLYDVSPVTWPANPGTDIGVSERSLFDGAIEEYKQELLEREKALELAKAKARAI